MRKEIDCVSCGGSNFFITNTNDLRPETLCLLGLICEDCGHVVCCANCGVWENDDGILDHEDYCIDKEDS